MLGESVLSVTIHTNTHTHTHKRTRARTHKHRHTNTDTDRHRHRHRQTQTQTQPKLCVQFKACDCAYVRLCPSFRRSPSLSLRRLQSLARMESAARKQRCPANSTRDGWRWQVESPTHSCSACARLPCVAAETLPRQALPCSVLQPSAASNHPLCECEHEPAHGSPLKPHGRDRAYGSDIIKANWHRITPHRWFRKGSRGSPLYAAR
jgi:hypothetical protein